MSICTHPSTALHSAYSHHRRDQFVPSSVKNHISAPNSFSPTALVSNPVLTFILFFSLFQSTSHRPFDLLQIYPNFYTTRPTLPQSPVFDPGFRLSRSAVSLLAISPFTLLHFLCQCRLLAITEITPAPAIVGPFPTLWSLLQPHRQLLLSQLLFLPREVVAHLAVKADNHDYRYIIQVGPNLCFLASLSLPEHGGGNCEGESVLLGVTA